MGAGRSSRRWVAGLLGCLLWWFFGVSGTRAQANVHTDPLNLDPEVKQGFEHFYNLDYEGALKIFSGVAAGHPQEPMAWNYVLLVSMFRELFHLDLLDTTY